MTLPPISDENWPAELEHLQGRYVGTANVYRVMAHHPALLASWSAYRDHVVTGNSLGRERSEVAILRIGHRLDSPYEWAHHVVRSRAAGLSDERILAIRGAPEAMAGGDAIIVRAVDALLDGSRLPEPLLGDLTARVGAKGVLDLMATVGLYSTLAFLLNTYQPPIDDDIAEELLRNPIGQDVPAG